MSTKVIYIRVVIALKNDYEFLKTKIHVFSWHRMSNKNPRIDGQCPAKVVAESKLFL